MSRERGPALLDPPPPRNEVDRLILAVEQMSLRDHLEGPHGERILESLCGAYAAITTRDVPTPTDVAADSAP